MTAPQSPPLAVFIAAQTVPGADMPSQRLPAIAAIETDHIVPVHGTTHGYSGSQNFFGLTWPSKLSQRSMNRRDEF